MPRKRTPSRKDIGKPELVVHCHCECPMWGKHSDYDASVVKSDDCGHEFVACNRCLLDGRLTDCRICHHANRLN